MGSVVGAVLSFLGKSVGFVAERIWALIVFVAGLFGWWLLQKGKKSQPFASACSPMHLDRNRQRAKSLVRCVLKYTYLCGSKTL